MGNTNIKHQRHERDTIVSKKTETIGNEYDRYNQCQSSLKWWGIVKGSNNCLYCIPFLANRILKIDPSNDEIKLVGENCDNGGWRSGFARGDFIYCIPCYANRFLKFNIKTETSELVGDDLGNDQSKWRSGAVAEDGCFYCFPSCHTRILKFDPSNDTTSFVGEEIEGEFKFSATIKAKNGLYGIPNCASRVTKFNFATQKVTFIGDKFEGDWKWEGGLDGMDNNIYGVPHIQKKWLKIDTATETTSLVGNDLCEYGGDKYNGGVVGEDCNVYSVPYNANKVIKYNTTTQKSSEVGNRYDGDNKWSGGVLHPNGYIYCSPLHDKRVLKIKTNHIREEGIKLLQSNASLTGFMKYINTYNFEYIYVTHKALYNRLVAYRNKLIVESAMLALRGKADEVGRQMAPPICSYLEVC